MPAMAIILPSGINMSRAVPGFQPVTAAQADGNSLFLRVWQRDGCTAAASWRASHYYTERIFLARNYQRL
jgi:hypothetical protein